jgi:hypothetical protein
MERVSDLNQFSNIQKHTIHSRAKNKDTYIHKQYCMWVKSEVGQKTTTKRLFLSNYSTAINS